MTCSVCLGFGCPACEPDPFEELCENCWRAEEEVCDGTPDPDGKCPRMRELEEDAAQNEYDRREEDGF